MCSTSSPTRRRACSPIRGLAFRLAAVLLGLLPLAAAEGLFRALSAGLGTTSFVIANSSATGNADVFAAIRHSILA